MSWAGAKDHRNSRDGEGPVRLKILQTQTPINQETLEEGLYLADGTLIGVSPGQGQSTGRGISFAITGFLVFV
jgi:S1-C subfamily serine protease